MKFTRPSRVFAALLALVGVLYMQLALAAYVCPEVVKAPAPVMKQMASCADMALDPEQPTLCAGQDYTSANSLDKPAAPTVVPFIAAAQVGTVVLAAPPFIEGASVARHSPLPAPPPVSLLHCCLRL